MNSIVGFCNKAVYDCQNLNVNILETILIEHLVYFQDYIDELKRGF